MNDDIILKFTNAELLIDDSAYKKIEQQENSLQFADSLIQDVSGSKSDLFILTGAIVDQFLQKNIANQIISNYSAENIESTEEGYTALDTVNISQSKLVDIPFNFEVLQDASKKSYTNGEIKDFTSYFNSRFQKLKALASEKTWTS